MDFLNRNGQTQQGRPVAPSNNMPHAPAPNHDNEKMRHGGAFHNMPAWLRMANVVLLFSITVLAIAIAFMLHSSQPNEGKYVLSSKYQAVFLENGQVYFGKIGSLTSKFIDLQNVFYLNSQNSTNNKNADSTANQFTLIKLGCELHGPYNQMIINRDQVTFWENLKDDGQVVKTVNEWFKQNPNGQKCSSTSSSTSQSSSNSATQSTNTSATQNSSSTTTSGSGN